MIIQKTGLLDMLNAQVQYRIPIYQRKYDWPEKDCLTLLDNIIEIATDGQRDQHFVGSIIYKNETGATTVGAVNVNFVIDGQQRLTTLMLILWALGHYAKDTVDPDVYNKDDYSLRLDAIKEYYLTNSSRISETDKYYKLMPIGDDALAYNALLNDKPLPSSLTTSKIYDNYNSILRKIKSEAVDPETIMKGIKKLVIANISLEDRDNPQLIFETVNSTGKPLKDVDKVRNYLLMNAGEEKQNQLYNNNWSPMENRLKVPIDGGITLNGFFEYYAAIITEEKVSSEYYPVFKDHYLGISPDGILSAVEDMDAYSLLYKRWLDCNENSNDIDLLLYRIKRTGVWQCIPVVLKALRNNEMELLTNQDLKCILELLESYIIRRGLCGLSTNRIGDAFVKMLKHVDSFANIKICIAKDLTNNQRFPTDNEVKNSLTTVDFYGTKHDHYILDRIEKSLNPAYMPNHETIQIEHIMPQTIESSEELYARTDYSDKEKQDRDWAKDLGENWKEIHEKYCNKIGNLTLTGYNSRLSNCRFLVKRDLKEKADDGIIYGYSVSAIRLSHGLRTLEQWGEDEIISRSNSFLYPRIVNLWSYPIIPNNIEDSDASLSSLDDERSREYVRNRLLTGDNYVEIKRNRVYKTSNDENGFVILASKLYPKGTEEEYWFGYRKEPLELIAECTNKVCLFVCRGKKLYVAKIPVDFLDSYKEKFHSTTDNDGNIKHYHIYLRRNLNGQFNLFLSKSERIDISSYITEYDIN